jgi:hypothetical protein
MVAGIGIRKWEKRKSENYDRTDTVYRVPEGRTLFVSSSSHADIMIHRGSDGNVAPSTRRSGYDSTMLDKKADIHQAT